MNVLHVTPSFYPASYWGGAIFVDYELCNRLSAIPQIKLKVLATDTAGPALRERVRPTSFPVVHPNGYQVFFHRRVFLDSVAPGLLLHLRRLADWADVVHLTGVYSFPTLPTLLVCRLLGKPLVWSPHGALQRWRDTRKRVAKSAWEAACNALYCRERSVLHVTSTTEAAESSKRIRGSRIAVIPNGVDGPENLPIRHWCPKGNLRIGFLGRIDPIKGIENLIRAVALLDKPATLDVYGSGDNGYCSKLKDFTSSLNLASVVKFHGQLSPQERVFAFSRMDICVVPSYIENFCMVVAEALIHGVPVIVSKGAPWADVEKHACGLWEDNTPESLANAISRMRIMNLAEMGRRGRKWMQRDLCWDKVVNETIKVYEDLTMSRKQ